MSKRKVDPPRRPRARDLGKVVAWGTEISADIDRAAEACRTAKRWSKRALLEEALRRFCEAEGFPVPKASA